MSVQRASDIPHFQLYGDEPGGVELDFLHVETIRARSSLHDWLIRPHAHPEHAQVFLVTEGATRLQIEDSDWSVSAPAIYVIPAACVHHMQFEPGSDGFVVTVSLSYLQGVAAVDAVLSAVADKPMCSALEPAVAAEAAAAFDALAREFVWPAPGRRAAIAAHLVRILVTLLRRSHAVGAEAARDAPTPSRDGELVRRFRRSLEERFRRPLPVPAYAQALNVTQSRLNAACRAVTGRSASRLVQDRIMVEAKRNLLYTSLTVAEIAHAVGFEDPAYFNRFFTRRAGMSPGRFRQQSRIAQAPQAD